MRQSIKVHCIENARGIEVFTKVFTPHICDVVGCEGLREKSDSVCVYIYIYIFGIEQRLGLVLQCIRSIAIMISVDF